ncbi:MAG TPA: trypsin-like peptidase domain-containing protein [Actinospica sp.]|nr:trypsin-like peptidase domain-containing protein [Actinospica sp.]
MNVLPLLCAKLFAPLTALSTALATIAGLPAADPRSRDAPAPPPAVLTGDSPSTPAAGLAFPGAPQVGAIVWQTQDGLPGARLCSAVAVDSPAGDLIATAAHCMAGVTLGLGGPLTIAYVPGYHAGHAPYGIWYPTRVTEAPQWISAKDPDYDLAFLDVARPQSAVPLEQVTGAEHLGGPVAVGTLGVLLGYPYNTDRPVGCRAAIAQRSATQLRFDCANFPTGTSGGPLLTAVDPHTGIGTLAGVIGGYQQGGTRDDVSYVTALRPPLAALYEQAATGEVPPLLFNGLL